MGPSYVLLHPFYIRWSLYMECHTYYYGSILCTPIIVGSYSCTQDGPYIYGVSYVLLWVHLMYTDYCGVLLLYTRWSLYIWSVIRTIMGPSYVHRLLWGLTPVHKMVPIYMECHTYYYGSILCTPIIVGSYSCTQDGPYIYGVSYVLLWVHLMYTDYCGVLLLYIRWSLYIWSVIRTIMGPSYVHRLLWGLTPVHRMVPI